MQPESPGRSRILTIPNIVSFVRLIGVGVFWWVLLVEDDVAAAAWFVFVIGWTDWVDGYLARRLNQVSELGKILDPVADRLMIVSAVLGGLIAGVVPAVIGIPLLVREVVMGGVALCLASRRCGTLEVRHLGKAATFALYGAIPAFYLAAAGVLETLMSGLGWFFGALGLILYWYVMLEYIGDMKRLLSRLESHGEPHLVTEDP